MGCASSKRIDVAGDVYRHAPSSFAVFDVNAIVEPWVKDGGDEVDSIDEKPSRVPVQLLEKPNTIDEAPRSWEEVSKALADLKPKLTAAPALPPPPSVEKLEAPPPKEANKKSSRIHTLRGHLPAARRRRGGGVHDDAWRTYEDCKRVRQLMETHQIVFDERDVAMDGGFLSELRELVGEEAAVPRVFVKGRYIGGVEEVVGLNETGRLSRILNSARVERGVGSLGCGGKRFVPCMECGGSCKIVVGDERVKCGECNENGLTQCPVCV